VAVWDIARKGCLWSEKGEHYHRSLEWSSDGQTLFIGTTDGTIRVVETNSWSTVRTLPRPGHVSADGTAYISLTDRKDAGGQDLSWIVVTDYLTSETIAEIPVGWKALRLSCSPDGRLIAVSSEYGRQIRILPGFTRRSLVDFLPFEKLLLDSGSLRLGLAQRWFDARTPCDAE
jgi:hypothetical protein